jgi:uncharacterized protein YciI
MSSDPPDETVRLLAPMIRKALWAVLSKAVVPSCAMEPYAPEHLLYMKQLEDSGELWASGPFAQPGALVADGLTILNVSTEADVHRIMQAEPLTRRELRTYEVRKWELREGRLSIGLLCSQSKFTLL